MSTKRRGSCWIPGSWDLPMSYNPIVVTLSSLKPCFFNGLKTELGFSDHAWSIRPRNPIRAFWPYKDRLLVETVLSMLTVVCHCKKIMHRVWTSVHARLAFTMAAFNVLVRWHGLQPNASGFVPLSMAEFSLQNTNIIIWYVKD